MRESIKIRRFCLSNLSHREQQIFSYRYMQKGWTLAMLGKKFHVSTERIRQVEARAFRKLRRNLGILGYIMLLKKEAS